MLERITLEQFEPLVGTDLNVTAGATTVALEVKEVRAIRNPSPRPTPPFAVVLRSRSGWQGAQGIYRIAHPILGDLDLFVVPIAPDSVGPCYEVVFN